MNFLDPGQTEQFIKQKFAEQPERLNHVLVVADRVRQSARDINELQPSTYISERLAYCAGLVHDIGYIAEAVQTGFHPIDGFRFLRKGGHNQLAEIIVGHSSAPEEAHLLGISGVTISAHLAAKLITYWDMHVLQGGEQVTYEERLEDIRLRHGDESIVWQAHLQAKPRLLQIFDEIRSLLKEKVVSE